MQRFLLRIILCLAIISPLGTIGVEDCLTEHSTQQDVDFDYIQHKEHSVISRGEDHTQSLSIIITLILISICVLRTINTKKLKLYLFCLARLFKHLDNLIPIQFQSRLFDYSFSNS